MKHTADRIQSFYQKHYKLCYIQSFNLLRYQNERGLLTDNLVVTLTTLPIVEEGPQLIITFEDVKDLQIGSFQGAIRLDIKIQDISVDQLENISFSVKEEEYDTFSFVCRSFDWVRTY
ncbi:hypothetical protein M3194_04570 [Paenibacillus glycanilyticus]|uniref:hypothetical protein n=1 Tax=Paenibacillus glycanilyticus TaxID=126569 RepID=UPI0020405D60|nr:hypothetical protein [Paenibacillus glycanilyticus]MCM3626638.1 hypothetical protein [Paenibacillus glycanilyticus]